MPAVAEKNFLNSFLQPDLSTLHQCKWVTDKTVKMRASNLDPKFHVYQVVCDLIWPSGQPMQAHPRVVVQRLLHELKVKYNLNLYSGFEAEFCAFEPDSIHHSLVQPSANDKTSQSSFKSSSKSCDQPRHPKPCTTGHDMFKTSILAIYEEFFMDLGSQMSSVGIDIQDFVNENGQAQLECPLVAAMGIKSADDYFTFKQASKEIGKKYGMVLSYMPKPLFDDAGSGSHFNHSLWRMDEGKNGMVNAFHDPSDKHRLSGIARHWIGGLMEHLPAMVALYCPTVNCYRRLHKHFAPDAVNWDINDRFSAVRVKNHTETDTYIESRTPSSAACSYHVVAATLAAGMNGLDKKLEPPIRGLKPGGMMAKDMKMLAYSLEEALESLHADRTFVERVGADFVDWFIRVKRNADLKTLSQVDVKRELDSDIAMERYEYMIHI